MIFTALQTAGAFGLGLVFGGVAGVLATLWTIRFLDREGL